MKNILSASFFIILLSACNNDEIYTAQAIAVNHTGPDVDIIYHNSESSSSLTNLNGLQYGEISAWNLLTQDQQDETVYTFSAVNANSQETIIDKISFDFSGVENVLLFSFGKESGVEQQAATLHGLTIDFDDIAEDRYAVYVVHSYPAELGKLALSLSNATQSTTLDDDGLGYGHATSRYTFTTDVNRLVVKQYESDNAPLLEQTIQFEANTVNVILIAPESHHSNQINVFNYPLPDMS